LALTEKEKKKRRVICVKKWRAANPLANAMARAARKNISFELTNDWYWEIVDRGYCQASGLPFVINDKLKHPFSPSVDQIVPGGGYTFENSRITCLIFNTAKNGWHDEDVLKLSRGMVEKHGNSDSGSIDKYLGNSVFRGHWQKVAGCDGVEDRAWCPQEN
jgi:hypothetical protein